MAKPCKTMWTGVVLGALTLSPVAKPQAATCTAAQAVAVVVSTQGTVTDAGHTLRSGEPLCAGDQIRTAANSRAVLRLAHGNAMFHLDAGTVLEMHAPAERDSVGLIEGAINALFRQPGELEIDTPILNASIKGTEYLVRVQPDGANTVAVFDGVVQVQGHGGVEAAQGAVAVASGQRVSVKAGNTLSPGALKVAVASDELAWSLYFPPVVSTTAAAPVRAAAEQLSQGNPMAAEALLGDPSLANDASALALRAVSAVVRNAPTAARELAEQAVTLAPDNAAAHIALSYARQANLAVDGALATLEDCVNTKSCDSQQPVFQARLIELKLASGDTRGALRHCPEPVDDARAMACGFAQLANGKSTLAGTLLAQAVTAQPGNPLARLGLGLARIRGNDVPGGRAEIETAMLLDPLQSVIRSYLGKAYFEERHCPTGLGGARCGWLSTRPLDLALEQYDIARRLDPKDPTPDLYSAIAKQAYNRPVEALTDLQRSIDKNDNRAVYRSSLLLDRDEASRAAGLAQLYRGLGFDQLALAEGYRSLAVDPGNFAAHRFLADAYSALPRHDVARVSEVLQTQLLQPINAAPLPPQLGEQDQQAFSGAGPASLSFNEFNAAFLRNGLSGTLDTVFGSNETFGQNLGANLVQDRYSVHFGFYGYDTDGRRSNNDDSRRLYDVFGQLQVLANTMLIAEFKHLDTETGDLDAKFDEDAFESLRNSAPTDQYRVGLRHEFSPTATFIGHYTERTSRNLAVFGIGIPGYRFELPLDQQSQQFELQHLWRPANWWKTTVGGGMQTIREDSGFNFIIDNPPFFSGTSEHPATRYDNLYLYNYLDLTRQLTVIVGGSADRFRGPLREVTALNPKAGVVWQLTPQTTFRMATFRALKRPLLAAQTIEPTQVAGFNQFFDDEPGAPSRRYGFAIDHRLSSQVFVGIEGSQREVDNRITGGGPGGFAYDRQSGHLMRSYAYWTVTSRLALNSEFEFEQRHRDAECVTPNSVQDFDARRWRIGGAYHHPAGVSLGITAQYIDQSGDFAGQGAGQCDLPVSQIQYRERGGDFVTLDLRLGYKLPARLGEINVIARNLFDKRYHFDDTYPQLPHQERPQGVFLVTHFYFD